MKIFFSVVLVFTFSICVFGQTNARVEKELISVIKDIGKYSTYAGNYDEDKLYKANDDFKEKLLKYTKNASTLSYKFPELSQSILIATSDDGKLRVYSWDMETGGTMHDYARVYQYQDGDGKIYSRTDPDVTAEDGGGGSFVYDIFSVDSKQGRIYVVCSTFIGSTQDHWQGAHLYKIEGNQLKDKIKLIKTASGLTDSLGFSYNFFSVVERRERPIKLISFDKKTNTLKIPVVIEDKEFSNGRVTNRFISYRFNGTYFVKVS
jgi:hypothetical protein